MRKILFFCLIAVPLFTACSQTERDIFATLHGIVSNEETGEPVAGVVVVLSPSGTTKVTGSDGYFEFRKLTPQLYTLTTQKTGYTTNRKSINAISGDDTEINIPITKQ